MRLAALLLLFGLQALAYPNGYLYRRTITVGAAVVPSTQLSFPMLVETTLSTLATVANGGKVVNTVTLNSQTVPADLIFTSDAAGSTLLNWEVSSYTATSGAIDAWVKIPTLSNGTVIYMFYGNAAITTYQGNASSAWDSNYKAVYHLSNGSVLSSIDSTGNANNGTATSVAALASGKVNGAATFNNTNSIIDGGTGSSMAGLFTSGGSLEAWINPNSPGQGGNGRILNRTASGDTAPANGWFLQTTGTAIKYAVGWSGTTGAWTTASSLITFSGTWQHIALTYNGSSAANVPIFYINGSPASLGTTVTPVGTINADSALHTAIGNMLAQNRTFDGGIDEVRLSNTVRAASWITTEFNNQNNPAAFLTIGPQLYGIGGSTTIIW